MDCPDWCNGEGQQAAARRFAAGESTARANLARGVPVADLRSCVVHSDDADWRAGYLAEVERIERSAYDAACERVDAWRAERLRGVRRVSATRWTAPGQPDEHRMYATERLGFVAEGRGVSLEAATIDLARKLPLPAPAPLPTRTTYAELGLADLGAESSCGATVRPLRAVAR